VTVLLEDLALIGNCQFSALVERSGAVVWCCLPRFDSEPIFSRLLDHELGGQFLIGPADGGMGQQRYLDNTNVVETTFRTEDGAFRVIDFAPRFSVHERMFRPTQLIRVIEPLQGSPRVRIRCEPRLGWSKAAPSQTWGSHHVEFGGFAAPLRLTTDVPLSYLQGHPFTLVERRQMVLTWGAPVEEPLAPLVDRFFAQTIRYWQRWVKHCNIPPLFQQEVIRSALALKLHCFEDTGAIIAATTTSIPEAPGSGRTWDYRYCWLRDAYYSLGAFRLLGHFEEREEFVKYLLNIAGGRPDLALSPLYRVDGSSDLGEQVLSQWPGFNGEQPVRVGNAAAEHTQNDIFGEMVLALAPVFLDDRLRQEQTRPALELVERLARKAIAVAGTPDAGIWEYRTEWKPQTFSSVMCWAAADRMSKIAERHLPAKVAEFTGAASKIREEILGRAFNPDLKSLVATYDGKDLDASLLQAVTLRLLNDGDVRRNGTIDAVWKGLTRDGWLLRYKVDDGFGVPTVAFIICTFWLVEALATAGRLDEARQVMSHVHSAMSPLGLISEDYETTNLRMWGNFPQAYSHVGLIHAAFAASPKWAEIL
jgi:GH15 family glucan-1,4-alpha-glucosidase